MTDDIIIHPLKTSKDVTVPSQGILFVNPGEAKAVLTTVLEQGGKRAFLHNSQLAITSAKDLFVAGPAIGAPSAVLVMEKLIVLGARSIILMGWCGAVDNGYSIGDIVIPTGAVCGEGTSQNYSDETNPSPSPIAVSALKTMLDGENLSYREGRIWSTDAPYRESRSHLRRLNAQENVVGVDMEFSALCNVAAFRKIDFGAVLIVSDELWSTTWKPGFKNKRFQQQCRQVQHCLINRQDKA